MDYDRYDHKSENYGTGAFFHPLNYRKGCLLSVLILGLLAGIFYSNSFQGPMIFDDVPSIVYNRSIRSLTPLTEVLLPPTDTGVLRRPLVNLTLALNFQISQLRVWSYHLLNLIIHLLAALTLTGVMIHLLKQDHFQGRYRYSGGWLSLTIAAVWMLHPLQTESVTYIIQRCESLMGLLYLLTLLCAVKGWHSQRPALWHGAAIIFAILGIAAKEVMVTAPIMVLAFDCFFNRRSILQAMKDSKLLYFGLFFTWAPLAWLTMRGGAVAPLRTDSNIPH